MIWTLGLGIVNALAQDAPPPAMRALWEIPLAPVRAGPFLDEEDVVDAVVDVLGDDLPEVRGVEVAFTREALVPAVAGSRVVSPRFLGDGPGVEAQLDALSKALYKERLSFGSDRSARIERLHVVGCAALAHEMAQSAAEARGVAPAEDRWAEEKRAVAVEWAVLNRWVAEGRVPASWLSAYLEATESMLAASPRGLLPTLPADDAARGAMFNAGYGAWSATLGGDPPSGVSVDQVTALSAQLRWDTAQHPPMSSAELRAAFAYPPPLPPADAARVFAAELGVTELSQAPYRYQPGEAGPWAVEIWATAEEVRLAYVWTEPIGRKASLAKAVDAVTDAHPPSPWTTRGGRLMAQAVLRGGEWGVPEAYAALSVIEAAVISDGERLIAAGSR